MVNQTYLNLISNKKFNFESEIRFKMPKINFVEEFKNMSNHIGRLAQTDNKIKPYLSKSHDPYLLKPM